MTAQSTGSVPLLEPMEPLESAAERLAEIRRRFDESRSERRFYITLPALVQELDENNGPVGRPFQLIVRDVSNTGFGLLHSRPVTSKRLAIEVSLSADVEDPPVRAITDVLRCREIVPGLYDLGCRVVKRLPTS